MTKKISTCLSVLISFLFVISVFGCVDFASAEGVAEVNWGSMTDKMLSYHNGVCGKGDYAPVADLNTNRLENLVVYGGYFHLKPGVYRLEADAAMPGPATSIALMRNGGQTVIAELTGETAILHSYLFFTYNGPEYDNVELYIRAKYGDGSNYFKKAVLFRCFAHEINVHSNSQNSANHPKLYRCCDTFCNGIFGSLKDYSSPSLSCTNNDAVGLAGIFAQGNENSERLFESSFNSSSHVGSGNLAVDPKNHPIFGDVYFVWNYNLKIVVGKGIDSVFYKFNNDADYKKVTSDCNVQMNYGYRLFLYATVNQFFVADGDEMSTLCYSRENPLDAHVTGKFDYMPSACGKDISMAEQHLTPVEFSSEEQRVPFSQPVGGTGSYSYVNISERIKDDHQVHLLRAEDGYVYIRGGTPVNIYNLVVKAKDNVTGAECKALLVITVKKPVAKTQSFDSSAKAGNAETVTRNDVELSENDPVVEILKENKTEISVKKADTVILEDEPEHKASEKFLEQYAESDKVQNGNESKEPVTDKQVTVSSVNSADSTFGAVLLFIKNTFRVLQWIKTLFEQLF